MGGAARARPRPWRGAAALGIAVAASSASLLLLSAQDFVQLRRQPDHCLVAAALGGRCTRRPPRRRVQCRAMPWEGMKLENPLKGSWVDPGYWQEQTFIVAQLKRFRPDQKLMWVLELCPASGKHLGYLNDKDKKGAERLVGTYIAFGEVEDGAQTDIKAVSQTYFNEIMFRFWNPKTRVGQKKKGGGILDIEPKSVNLVLVGKEVISRLGADMVARYLADIVRLMKDDGTVIFMCDKKDEKTLCSGDTLENLISFQDVPEEDLEDLGDLVLGLDEKPTSYFLQEVGLQLVNVERFAEGDLACGVCTRCKKRPVIKTSRSRPSVQQAAAPRRASTTPRPKRKLRRS